MKKKFKIVCLLFAAFFFSAFAVGPAAAEAAAHAESTVNASDPFSASINPDAAFLARMSGIFDVEDPSSLYDFNVNDKEVEFIVDGTWEMNLLSSLEIDYSQGTPVLGYTPPVLTQVVNMTTWIFIDKTWYFESSFTEAFTKNTVAAGYVGNDDTVIKHVRIGNSGIVFPSDYPFVQIGGGKSIAPGVMGTFAGDNWNADAIVRYDAAAIASLQFSGMNEVTDTLVPVTVPLRGKCFVLPDTPVTGAISVYVEDTSGSIVDAGGRHWRKLELAEYSVDGVLGVVELDTAATGSVAIRYGGTYSNTSDGGALANFIDDSANYFASEAAKSGMKMPAGFLPTTSAGRASRFLLSLDGSTALLVRERGRFSPFDSGHLYLANGTKFELVYSESGVKPAGFTVNAKGSAYAEIQRDDTDDVNGIRTPEGRFPLAAEFPFLYLPSYGGMKPDTDLAIRSRTYTPVSSISLGSDVIPGTIIVTRNGIPDTDFRFDEDSGILQLATMPLSSETIQITWYKSDQTARNGTLTVAGGFRWKPSEPLEFSAASALRWNTTKDGYTTSTDSSPGSYIVSSGVSWKTENLKVATAFAFDVLVPDTTGLYRMLGMDTTSDTLYPSSSWYETVQSSISPVIGKPFNTSASDITLARENYVTPEGTNGTTPHSITDTSVTGSVLVLKCDLSSAVSWTGANVAVGTSGNADLSAARTVAIALRNSGSTTDFDVYLQLGVKSGDNWENSENVRTWKLVTPDANSKWAIRTITLDAADRNALSAGNDFRLLVRPSAASVPSTINPVNVWLCSGPIEVTESGFGAETTGVALSEIDDPLSGSNSLDSSQADVINRFNSGTKNTVLEADIAPDTGSDSIRISKTVPEVPFSSYQQFSFYIYCPSDPGLSSRIKIALSRPSDSGTGTENACIFEIQPASLDHSASHTWHKVSLDLEKERVSIDGSILSRTDAPVTLVNHATAPTKITVTFENWAQATETAPLKVYFDEFHLAESSPVQTARNQSSFSWKKQGALFSLGNVPLISSPTIATNSVESIVIGKPDVSASGNASAGISLLNARVDGSVSVSNTTRSPLEQASHTVTIPIGPFGTTERFSADFSSKTLSRENTALLSGPLAVGVSLGAEQSDSKIDRRAGFTVTPALPDTPIGTFVVSAGSAFSQSGTSPIPDIAESAWSDLWQKSFRAMLSKGESDADKRTGKTSLHAEWNSEGNILSAIRFDTEGDSSYQAGSETSIEDELSYGWSIPFDFTSFSLTPGWKRTASEKKITSAGGSWSSDTKSLAASCRDQRWLFSVAPIADIFHPSIDGVIADNGTWSRNFSNTYTMDWQRPSPGLLSDLWTPSTVKTSIKRETETDATASNVRDIWTASAQAGFSALNIAGSQGLLHVFPWYAQDEISQLYGWTPKWGTGFFMWSADTWHSVTLFFSNSGSIAVENTWHYDSPDMSGKNELARDAVRLVWKRPGQNSPIIEPLRRMTTLPLTTRREDSLTWSITLQKSSKTETMAYDHLLATGIGKNGELQISTGAETESTEKGLQSVTIKLGVGGKLTY